MGGQVQIWEIRPDGRYVAASQFGPTYNGPVGRLQFVNGVAAACMGHPRDSFTGTEVRTAGNLSLVWEYFEGHAIQWVGDSWKYAPAHPEPAPAPKPAPEPVSESSPGRRPAAPDAEPTKRRVRRVRCLGCDKLFRKGQLVDGRCRKCRD